MTYASDKIGDPMARKIVANLLHRARRACRYLRRNQAMNLPESVIQQAEGAYIEALNAANTSRQILYSSEPEIMQDSPASHAPAPRG